MARKVKQLAYGEKQLGEKVEDYFLSPEGRKFNLRLRWGVMLFVVLCAAAYSMFHVYMYRYSARTPFGFKHAFELFFSSGRVDFFGAEKNAKEGKDEEAIAGYKKAVKKDSGLFSGYVRLGEIHLKSKQIQEAFLYFKKAYAIEPFNFYVCEKIGEIYGLQKKYPDAIVYLQRAVNIAPWKKEIYFLLGETYEKMGEGVEAIEAYETSLTKVPVDSPMSVDALKRMKELKKKVYP